MEEQEDEFMSFLQFLEGFNALTTDQKEPIEGDIDTTSTAAIRDSNSFVAKCEADAEILATSLQYLHQYKCPPVLAAAVSRAVLSDVHESDLEDILHSSADGSSEGYEPNALWKIVVSKVQEVCQHWSRTSMDNLRSLTSTKESISACSVKNVRRTMEDRHVVINDLNTLFGLKNEPPTRFYAVFDGHAGTDAASYSAIHLHYNIVHNPSYPEDIAKAMREAFVKTDEDFILKSNREGLKSGSTALCCLLRDRKLYVAWLGDSQAILVRGGRPVELMVPHKPDRLDERERIESLGGCVVHFGIWRVNGTLSVSRAIGDVDYKPYVSSDADVIDVDLDESDDFLVLACDGLWDFLQPDDAVRLVQSYLVENPGDLDGVAARLVQAAKEHSSSDNITVVVVFLRDFEDYCHTLSLPENRSNLIESALSQSVNVGTNCGDLLGSDDVALNGNPFGAYDSASQLKNDMFGVQDHFSTNEQFSTGDANVDVTYINHGFEAEWGTGTLRRNQLNPTSVAEFNSDLLEEQLVNGANSNNNPFESSLPISDLECRSQEVEQRHFITESSKYSISYEQHGTREEIVGHTTVDGCMIYKQDFMTSEGVPSESLAALQKTLIESTLSPDAKPFVMSGVSSACITDTLSHYVSHDEMPSLHPQVPTAPPAENSTPIDENIFLNVSNLGNNIIEPHFEEVHDKVVNEVNDIAAAEDTLHRRVGEIHERETPEITHELEASKDIHEREVVEKIHELESESDEEVHVREVTKKMHELELDEAMHDREVGAEVRERELVEEMYGSKLEEEMRERELAEEMRERELAEEMRQRELAEEMRQRELAEEMRQRELAEEMRQRELAEEMRQRELAEEMRQRELAEEMHQRELAEEMHQRELAEEMRERELAEEMRQRELAEEMRQRELAEKVHEQEAAEKIHEQETAKKMHDINDSLEMHDKREDEVHSPIAEQLRYNVAEELHSEEVLVEESSNELHYKSETGDGSEAFYNDKVHEKDIVATNDVSGEDNIVDIASYEVDDETKKQNSSSFIDVSSEVAVEVPTSSPLTDQPPIHAVESTTLITADVLAQDNLVLTSQPKQPDILSLELSSDSLIITEAENKGSELLEPVAIEKIPDNIPVADDVEDDESEDGEEWKFYRTDAKKDDGTKVESEILKELGKEAVAIEAAMQTNVSIESQHLANGEAESSSKVIAVVSPATEVSEKLVSIFDSNASQPPKVAEVNNKPSAKAAVKSKAPPTKGASAQPAAKPIAKGRSVAPSKPSTVSKSGPASKSADATAAKKPSTTSTLSSLRTSTVSAPSKTTTTTKTLSTATATTRRVATTTSTLAPRPKPASAAALSSTKASSTLTATRSSARSVPTSSSSTATQRSSTLTTAKVSKDQVNVVTTLRSKSTSTVTTAASNVATMKRPLPSTTAGRPSSRPPPPPKKETTTSTTRVAASSTTTKLDVKQTKETVNKQIVGNAKKAPISKPAASVNGDVRSPPKSATLNVKKLETTTFTSTTLSPRTKSASVATSKSPTNNSTMSRSMSSSSPRTPSSKPLSTLRAATLKTPPSAARTAKTPPKASSTTAITKRTKVVKIEDGLNEKGILDASAKERAAHIEDVAKNGGSDVDGVDKVGSPNDSGDCQVPTSNGHSHANMEAEDDLLMM